VDNTIASERWSGTGHGGEVPRVPALGQEHVLEPSFGDVRGRVQRDGLRPVELRDPD